MTIVEGVEGLAVMAKSTASALATEGYWVVCSEGGGGGVVGGGRESPGRRRGGRDGARTPIFWGWAENEK